MRKGGIGDQGEEDRGMEEDREEARKDGRDKEKGE